MHIDYYNFIFDGLFGKPILDFMYNFNTIGKTFITSSKIDFK